MSTPTLKTNVSPELKKLLGALSALRGMTLSDFLLQAVEAYLKLPENAQLIEKHQLGIPPTEVNSNGGGD